MPQFDPSYVWRRSCCGCWITFLTLYLLMSQLILPRITDILGQREDRIDGNLQRAEDAEGRGRPGAGRLSEGDRRRAGTRPRRRSPRRRPTSPPEPRAREAEFAKKMADQTAAAEAAHPRRQDPGAGRRARHRRRSRGADGRQADRRAGGRRRGGQAVDGVMKERAR